MCYIGGVCDVDVVEEEAAFASENLLSSHLCVNQQIEVSLWQPSLWAFFASALDNKTLCPS